MLVFGEAGGEPGPYLVAVLDRRDKQPCLYGKDLQQDTQLQLTDSLP